MQKKILFLLLTLCPLLAYSQNTSVSGNVTDENHQPLVGVVIHVEGTVIGTSTGTDGNFTINVTPGQTLNFSYIGMDKKRVEYKGQTLKIVLQENQKALDEVVVIGYQTVKKSDLTGAVGVYNSSTMKNRVVTGTVGDALTTMPGLTVRTSGAPGSEGKVEIRGTGTFGNSTPLYVVDGVVSDANRDFNFNDVESIQVLKDASAAAIYGSRAANGVIIVTTKKGTEGPMHIEVSSKLTAQWLPRYNLCNRDQWIKLNDLAFANGGKQPANHYDGNTNWQDVVFKTGIVQDQNISFSGGGKTSTYFLSANYQSNSGTTIGTDSKRFTLRSNTSASHQFGEKFKFTVGENIILSNYSINELNTNPMTDVWRMLPTISVYDPAHESTGGYGYGDGSRDVTFGSNPVAREDIEQTVDGNLRIRGNLTAGLEFNKLLKYNFNMGFDQSADTHSYLRKLGSWTYNQPIDPSILNKNQARSGSMVYDNTLEYTQVFGQHHINAVVGISYQNTFYEQIWGTKNDILMSGNDYFTQLDAGQSNPTTGGYRNLTKLFSIFGRANYNYADRYLLSLTVRRDQSSQFNPQYNTGIFPSISGAWRISNEKFFHSTLINDLKVRANYGELGSSNIGPWDWNSFINIFPQAAFGIDQTVVNGATQVLLANSNLRWEKQTQMNIGFDLSMLRNRFTASVDYYIKESKDVLTPMQILMCTGKTTTPPPGVDPNPYVNAATLRNSGVDLTLGWKSKAGKFNYSIDVNGSYLNNKIVSLGYGQSEITQWDTKSIVGHPIGEWYLIKTDGIFQNEGQVLAHKNSKGQVIQPNAKPGDVIYEDANDDGQITDADRQDCGSSIPKFQFGMNLGLSYKNFDLMAQFTSAFGYKIFNGPRSGYDLFSDNSNYRANYDAWTPDNPNGKDPRPIYGDSRNVIGGQDRWLENGNYVRLTQLALGYNVPKAVLGNYFRSIRLFVNAQNLLTITSYTGLDPEFLNSSIWDRSYDPAAIPNPRAFTFGAQISF